MSNTTEFDCDVCGSGDAEEITCLLSYSGGQPIHVCRNCGFVYVRARRSFQEIADDWSHNIFGAEHRYTARIPAIKARQTFVADTIDTEIGLEGKRVCDIGAGEGLFLAMLNAPEYGATVFGIEPSEELCAGMTDMGIANFAGPIESYLASDTAEPGAFDIVTIIWTLENCQDCRVMLDAANQLLKPGGHVVIGTGSRILVPFRKPLHYYIADNPTDTHNFRFSASTLEYLLAETGFAMNYVNRYIDNDVLCMIARKESGPVTGHRPTDDWREVIAFFERWDAETQAHYADR